MAFANFMSSFRYNRLIDDIKIPLHFVLTQTAYKKNDMSVVRGKEINQDKKVGSFKRERKNIHKNEDGPECIVSNYKFSSVILYNWHWTREKKYTAI